MIHIHRTNGYYIGQTRPIGCRLWHTVTGRRKSATSALAGAVAKMGCCDKRARALYVPTGENGSWYGPTVSMEAKRK
jgi:hypothetical protein